MTLVVVPAGRVMLTPKGSVPWSNNMEGLSTEHQPIPIVSSSHDAALDLILC